MQCSTHNAPCNTVHLYISLSLTNAEYSVKRVYARWASSSLKYTRPYINSCTYTRVCTSVCTPHTAPDGSPTNLTATPTSRSVTLQWSPPPVLSRNGILTHYVVVLANETWNTTQSHSITGEQRKRREADSEGVGEETQSLTVEHLRPFTTYTWEVAAVSGFGAGPSTGRRRFETHQDGE